MRPAQTYDGIDRRGELCVGAPDENIAGDRGAVTAEACVLTVAAVSFATTLLRIILSPTMNDLLESAFEMSLGWLF